MKPVKLDKTDLKILELTKQYISGEKLAKILGISRAAVWKRIKKLEELGYRFSHSKKGYLLKETSPYLLENEVKPLLNTELLGNEYLWFKTVSSTNDIGKEKNFPEGTVIVAEEQTKGRGRKGRKWVSVAEKGLYFSIVLKPKLPINKILQHALLFPLAIVKTIEEFTSLKPFIKWPNDIYINGKKVSGVLIETEIENNEIKKAVIGIGINVNLNEKDLEPVKDIASSLALEADIPIDRKVFFAKLLKNIENMYQDFIENKLNVVKEVNKLLLWKGEKVFVIDECKVVSGKIVGLNPVGGLVIEKNGKRKEFYTGDVSLRKQLSVN